MLLGCWMDAACWACRAITTSGRCWPARMCVAGANARIRGDGNQSTYWYIAVHTDAYVIGTYTPGTLPSQHARDQNDDKTMTAEDRRNWTADGKIRLAAARTQNRKSHSRNLSEFAPSSGTALHRLAGLERRIITPASNQRARTQARRTWRAGHLPSSQPYEVNSSREQRPGSGGRTSGVAGE